MVNTKLSPADPIFFLHHAWLDRLWWQWQSRDPARLTEIGGENIPASTLPPFLSGPNATFVPPVDPACLLRQIGALPSANGTGATPNVTVPPIANPFAGVGAGSRITLPFAKPKPFPALTDYFNDDGNVTTLNHNLFSFGMMPNATAGSVLDLAGPLMCSEYA
jgi:tyrosinase